MDTVDDQVEVRTMSAPTPKELFEIRQRDAASGDTDLLRKAMASDLARPTISLLLDRRALLETIEYVSATLTGWRREGLVRSDGEWAIDALLAYLEGSPV